LTILRCPGMWFWHEVLHIEWFVFKAYTSYTLHCLGPFAGAILFTGLQEHGGGFMSTWWFLVGSLNLWTWGQRARVRVGCPSRWVGLQCESPNDFQIMQLKHWSCFFLSYQETILPFESLWCLLCFVFERYESIWHDVTSLRGLSSHLHGKPTPYSPCGLGLARVAVFSRMAAAKEVEVRDDRYGRSRL
jgi:hypothetical protein